jgi:predicted dehydrogenase
MRERLLTRYVVRVLTEKPMATDIDKCRRILETVQRTGNHLTVTFNYR